MLKLFKVMVGKEPFYFFWKKDAKRHRDMLPSNTSGKYGDRVVMRGPDHRRGESFNRTTRTVNSKWGWS